MEVSDKVQSVKRASLTEAKKFQSGFLSFMHYLLMRIIVKLSGGSYHAMMRNATKKNDIVYVDTCSIWGSHAA